MNTDISELDVILRLAATVAAGLLVGINREEHGRPAGLRTTMLMCLAASGAMILANLLMPTSGRPWNSYVSMDVMRLPLGILTGMGFIGAGAMMHKENLVVGVTTAATLWFASVMGLCFGAGEFGLGWLLLGLSLAVLWGLRWVEKHCRHRYEAEVVVVAAPDGPVEEAIVQAMRAEGYLIAPLKSALSGERREYRFEARSHVVKDPDGPPEALARMVGAGVREIIWSKRP